MGAGGTYVHSLFLSINTCKTQQSESTENNKVILIITRSWESVCTCTINTWSTRTVDSLDRGGEAFSVQSNRIQNFYFSLTKTRTDPVLSSEPAAVGGAKPHLDEKHLELLNPWASLCWSRSRRPTDRAPACFSGWWWPGAGRFGPGSSSCSRPVSAAWSPGVFSFFLGSVCGSEGVEILRSFIQAKVLVRLCKSTKIPCFKSYLSL